MRQKHLQPALLYIVIMAMAGCGSSPKETYYTLSSIDTMNGSTPTDGKPAYGVAVGPITLPEVIDRPQIVLRLGPNEVTYVELHRWAGPLRNEIPRVIADNLARYLNIRQVAAYPQSAGDNAEYRVLVDIQRFESMLGDSVMIDALWSIKRQPDGASRTGRSTVKEFSSGGTYEAVVAGHSRALATVSGEIAEAIRSMTATTSSR